jgi:hypothetical protein
MRHRRSDLRNRIAPYSESAGEKRMFRAVGQSSKAAPSETKWKETQHVRPYLDTLPQPSKAIEGVDVQEPNSTRPAFSHPVLLSSPIVSTPSSSHLPSLTFPQIIKSNPPTSPSTPRPTSQTSPPPTFGYAPIPTPPAYAYRTHQAISAPSDWDCNPPQHSHPLNSSASPDDS